MTAEANANSLPAELLRAKLYRWGALVALVVATLYIYFPHYPSTVKLEAPGFEWFAVADSLVEHHSFSDPFWAEPTGPTAHLGPLYPAYLALIITVFGRGSMAVGVLMWMASATLALQLLLLPLLARRFGLGFWTGVVASVSWLATGIAPTFLSDAGLIAVLAVLAAWFMRCSFNKEFSDLKLVITSIVWGALLLLQQVALIIFPFWLLLLQYRSSSSRRQKIALAILPWLVVVPWSVRNFLVLHAPILVRDNLGIELAVSNNDCASYSFKGSFDEGCFLREHPNESYAEAHRVVELGEVEYNRVRLRGGMDWIRSHPHAFLSLSAQRFRAFWVPPPETLRESADVVVLRPWLLYVFTMLAIPGLLLMWRTNCSSAYVIGLWLLLYPLIYYVVQYMARYRYPILWATFLPGSYFLSEVARGLLASKAQVKIDDLKPEEI